MKHRKSSYGLATRLSFASIFVVCFVLGSCSPEGKSAVTPIAGSAPVMEGPLLSSDVVEQMERALSAGEGGLRERLALIHFYQRSGQIKDAEGHVLRLIEEHPEAAKGSVTFSLTPFAGGAYEEGCDLWESHIRKAPDDLIFLRNAAAYMRFGHIDRNFELLARGEKLSPEDPYWPRQLGHRWMLRAKHEEEFKLDHARTALAAFERALLLYADQWQKPPLGLRLSIARAAWFAGELDQAERVAQDLVDNMKRAAGVSERDYSFGIHGACTVLGLVGVSRGEWSDAAEQLLRSGRVDGAPTLSSFGPNMLLAQKLLQHGQDDVVLEYFDLCRKFWPRPKLETWADDIHAGREPDFGGNLSYGF